MAPVHTSQARHLLATQRLLAAINATGSDEPIASPFPLLFRRLACSRAIRRGGLSTRHAAAFLLLVRPVHWCSPVSVLQAPHQIVVCLAHHLVRTCALLRLAIRRFVAFMRQAGFRPVAVGSQGITMLSCHAALTWPGGRHGRGLVKMAMRKTGKAHAPPGRQPEGTAFALS